MEPIFIVGRGLAGALLTHSLIDEGFKVYCTDAAIDHSASRVAAGLINPFIGPKLNIPWISGIALRLISDSSKIGKISMEKRFSRRKPYSESSLPSIKLLNGKNYLIHRNTRNRSFLKKI